MKNKFIKLGLIQSAVSADKNISLHNAAALVEQAAKSGAQIICLPELYRTIYFPQYPDANKDDYVETIPGESTEIFCQLAKKYDVVVIVPVYQKTVDGKYYNAAVVIDCDGTLKDTYHKMHIPHDPGFYEKHYFEEGDQGYKVYETKYAKFAVLICYDQWFPEAARIVALQGAEIIFYPTAIGNIVNHTPIEGDWHEAWETVMRGHAIANSISIAAINRTGTENTLDFWGQSFVCDAFGKLLARASKTEHEILICTVDLALNEFIKEGWGFFRNRRPDTYQALTDAQLHPKS